MLAICGISNPVYEVVSVEESEVLDDAFRTITAFRASSVWREEGS